MESGRVEVIEQELAVLHGYVFQQCHAHAHDGCTLDLAEIAEAGE
ncbi:hypothetical protein ULG90_09010 [Halopseudomonas pachastrellae]|nr:hypothetical protein ULG90_09010 [Halopseudomonas pachastrellae]